MLPRDTHGGAHAAVTRAHRAMTPARKAEIVVELSEALRNLARDGIRRRHPEYDAEEVRRALVVLLHGEDTARTMWPDREPVLP
jgi:hypothetical protein